jgi:hypothetical protein
MELVRKKDDVGVCFDILKYKFTNKFPALVPTKFKSIRNQQGKFPT